MSDSRFNPVTKPFKVVVRSKNTNSFGLRQHMLVSKDGDTWKVLWNHLNEKEIGAIVQVPLGLMNSPQWHLVHAEIPERMVHPPSPDELKLIWRKRIAYWKHSTGVHWMELYESELNGRFGVTTDQHISQGKPVDYSESDTLDEAEQRAETYLIVRRVGKIVLKQTEGKPVQHVKEGLARLQATQALGLARRTEVFKAVMQEVGATLDELRDPEASALKRKAIEQKIKDRGYITMLFSKCLEVLMEEEAQS